MHLRSGILCVLGLLASARGQDTGPPTPLVGELVPDTVVMLVGQAIEDLEAPVQDPARDLLAMPLNHLGLRLVRYDITGDAPPPDVDPARVAAVGTWFESEQQLPAWTWPWLERQAERVRTLHFGSLVPLARGDGGDRLRRHLRHFGLGYDDVQIADPARIEVDFVRRDAVPFESQPVYERLHYGPWNQDERNRIWLATRDLNRPRHQRTPVVTGPWGGIALQPWFVRSGGTAGDRRFYVDPFAFLGEALQREQLPAPDPSVRFGRRLFVLHVDGDGFESVSTVGEGHSCGEVFRDRIVDRWQVPMTISFIVASLTDRIDPPAPTPQMLLARDILSRPWVEPASHSVLHPLDWRRQLTPRSLPRSVVWYPALTGYEHGMVAEVRDSIAFVDRWLVPPDKRCAVMLWSGAANPTAAALAAARGAGCWNLNGGLFRWDELHDSVGYVTAWGAAIGDEFQVFAGAPNENVFPGYFTTMPGSFRHVDTTIENTGKRRILKPANVYVHFYSAEHPARLAALESLLERWLDREEVFPANASTYAAAADDCLRGCTIARTANGFAFAGFSHCRTVRFDAPIAAVDWARCRGIAGLRHVGDRTFVHLTAERAELAFVAAGTVAPGQPFVEQADCEVQDVALVAGGLRCSLAAAPGNRPRTLGVAGLPRNVDLLLDGVPGTTRGRSDADGRVVLRLPPGPRLDLHLAIATGVR